METNGGNKKIVTHDFPAWREKANFIIGIRLLDPGIADLAESEQIWARQIEENVFEVCCVPFFAYGIALGDLVSTIADKGEEYVINEIVERKGHTTYRIWFLDVQRWDSIVEEIKGLGCSVEVRWEKSKLIAVDAPTIEKKSSLEFYMSKLQADGTATCELAN